jgi:hypothetical protein
MVWHLLTIGNWFTAYVARGTRVSAENFKPCYFFAVIGYVLHTEVAGAAAGEVERRYMD